jgi:4-hydroxybenzoate polyprenyltransferase
MYMAMSDKQMTHLVCACTTGVSLFAWFGGYFSGREGWWWTIVLVAAVYFITLGVLSGGGHH